ncbi:MAG: CRISPR-associated protein Cas5 [Mycoplasmataceae bacterium]|nr:CRISPR-associated protein Cas5 [Mycoplasmataceae bacterium]
MSPLLFQVKVPLFSWKVEFKIGKSSTNLLIARTTLLASIVSWKVNKQRIVLSCSSFSKNLSCTRSKTSAFQLLAISFFALLLKFF